MDLFSSGRSSLEEYLEHGNDSPEARAEELVERDSRKLRFPFAVMLRVGFSELDFADRWGWVEFGPKDGECLQRFSRYRVCEIESEHSHVGVWTTNWFAKIGYDFGFNEWYFARRDHYDRFLAFLPELLNSSGS